MNLPLWFSLWSFPEPYSGNEPAFLDETEIICASAFTSQKEAIRTEVLTYLQSHKTIPYFKKSMVHQGKGYHTQSLAWWGIQFRKNQSELPNLTSILNNNPEILTLSINILDANSSILPHMGDTNAIYRGHFGISIPASLPLVGIRVHEKEQSWKEGEFIWFLDAYTHQTWNHSSEVRVVLLVDVLRPEFKNQKKRICATVMTSLFLQKRIEKYSLLKRNQRWIVTYLAPWLIPLVVFRIAWINFIRKY